MNSPTYTPRVAEDAPLPTAGGQVDERSELRYGDGPTADAEVHVDATPDVVWPLVCDIALPARFSAEFQGAEWLDDADGPRTGARFVGRNRHQAIGEWETTCTVVELERGRLFAYVVGDPSYPAATWTYTLAPDGDGTRLALRMRMGPARSGINLAIDAMPDKESRILRRRLGELRANMEATLFGIKGIAEGMQTGPR